MSTLKSGPKIFLAKRYLPGWWVSYALIGPALSALGWLWFARGFHYDIRFWLVELSTEAMAFAVGFTGACIGAIATWQLWESRRINLKPIRLELDEKRIRLFTNDDSQLIGEVDWGSVQALDLYGGLVFTGDLTTGSECVPIVPAIIQSLGLKSPVHLQIRSRSEWDEAKWPRFLKVKDGLLISIPPIFENHPEVQREFEKQFLASRK